MNIICSGLLSLDCIKEKINIKFIFKTKNSFGFIKLTILIKMADLRTDRRGYDSKLTAIINLKKNKNKKLQTV